MFDVLILAGKKDLNKIKFVHNSIVKNLLGYNNIYCICEEVPDLKVEGIKYYQDDEVLGERFNFNKFKGNVKKRKNWYTQQYIKLLQTITSDDYLVVDSDVFFNRKIEIIQNDKPTFLFGRNQHHTPYFEFNNKLLGFGRLYDYSFISEIMYFKRDIINDMLKRLNVDDVGFFDKSVEIINTLNEVSGMSEYELYGNYVYKYFREEYNYKNINTHLYGKHSIWSDGDMEQHIQRFKNFNYDIISMHSWV